MLSATVPPAQALGYWILVELGHVRRALPPDLLNAVVTAGSLPVTGCVLVLSAVIHLLRRGWKRSVVVVAPLCLVLAFTTALPHLGLHVDHGWFPHYATFPSGHMSGFLASCIALGSLMESPRWRTAKTVLGAVGGGVIALAILSVTAHTFWDVLGSFCLCQIVLVVLRAASASGKL